MREKGGERKERGGGKKEKVDGRKERGGGRKEKVAGRKEKSKGGRKETSGGKREKRGVKKEKRVGEGRTPCPSPWNASVGHKPHRTFAPPPTIKIGMKGQKPPASKMYQ